MKVVGSIKEFWRIQKVLLIILAVALVVLFVDSSIQRRTVGRLRAENVQLREQIDHEISRVDSLTMESKPLAKKQPAEWEYHSCVRVWSTSGNVCAEVYCQSEEEAQAVMNKVYDCLAGRLGTDIVKLGSAIVRGSEIGHAKIYRKE